MAKTPQKATGAPVTWTRIFRASGAVFVAIASALAFLIFFAGAWDGSGNFDWAGTSIRVPALLGVLLVIVAFYYSDTAASRRDRADQLERQKAINALEQKMASKPTVKAGMQLSFRHLDAYYEMSQSQARHSFRASVTAMVAGLIVLATSVGIILMPMPSYTQTNNEKVSHDAGERLPPALSGGTNRGQGSPDSEDTQKAGRSDWNSRSSRAAAPAMVSAIAGALVQFIAASYLYLYKTSLRQVNYFHKSITRLRDVMLAIELCGTGRSGKAASIRDKIIDALLSADCRKKPLPPPDDGGDISGAFEMAIRPNPNGTGILSRAGPRSKKR